MRKIVFHTILLISFVCTFHSGLTQIKLVVPHPYFMKPNYYLINGDYGVSCRAGLGINERVYCLYDLRTRKLIHSASACLDSLDSPYNFLEDVATDYRMSMAMPYEGSTALGNLSAMETDTLVARDRLNALIYVAATDDFFIRNRFNKLIPLVNSGFKSAFKTSQNVSFSISPDASVIGIVLQKRIYLYDTASEKLIWNSAKLKNPECGFSLQANHIVVLPQLTSDQKYQHIYWYDYQKNEIVFSSEMSMNASLLYEYQAYDHLMIMLGSPESKRPLSSFYIDLSSGYFSEKISYLKQDQYALAFYMRDSVVRQNLTQEAYDEYFENYTIYESWDQFLYQYYDLDYEQQTIEKKLLTPMTGDVEFFFENGYFDSNYPRFHIISAFRNKFTYKETTKDIQYYQLITLKKEILFWNGNMPKGQRKVSLVVTADGNPIFITPDNYFFAPKEKLSYLSFELDGKLYSFEQFDLKFNRPDIVLERLGYADSTLIRAYHQAYLKRLQKMGFTEDMLRDDIHIPEIEIKNRESLPAVSQDGKFDLNISFHDSKYKLDRINVWINDVAIYGTSGMSLRAQNLNSCDTTLYLNLARGSNRIEVSVMNQAGVESYKEAIEVTTETGKEKPDLYIVSLGVSTYRDTRYNLSYASKDAKDLVKTFQSSPMFGKVHERVLTDEMVNMENLSKIHNFLADAGIDDQVIVFVAGHGVLDENFDYYYASYDMDFSHPSVNGIPYGAIEKLLDGIKPLKKLLFMDTCHSGELDKDEIQKSGASSESAENVSFRAVGVSVENKKNQLGLQNTSELMRSLFTDLRKGTGSTVISSAGGVEFAMESDQWKNGLFTYCMIDGLTSAKADLNHDGAIMVSEIQDYVQGEVSRLSGGKQTPTSRMENRALDYRIW